VNSQHRVALVIGAKGWRGSGTSFAKIAQGLTARGHLVQVVVENERLARAFAAEGITATTVEMPGTSLAVLRRFRRALSPVPDVVLVDGPRELRLAALATLGWRTRLVFRYNLLFRRMLRDVVSRLFWTRIHAIVYQCEAIRRRALDESPWLGSRMSVRIPNGYDVDHFRPDPTARATVRERLGIPPDRPLVVTGGMPTKGKGHDTAVAALAAAMRTGPPFSWIAGVLVPVGDVAAMGGAVASLLADPHRRAAMGAAARARIAAEFPVERMVAGYEQLVRTLVASG